MISARMSAIIIVLALVGGLAFTGVVMTAWLGPMSAHGTNVLHVGGKITEVGPGKDFVFETNTHQQLDFVCDKNCRASLRHLIRHVKEKAPTDVYYVKGPGRELQVIDVD
jgi:hypothetical protein